MRGLVLCSRVGTIYAAPMGPIITASLKAEEPITGWLKTATPTLVVRCKTPAAGDPIAGIAARTPFLPVQPGLDVYVDLGMPATVENVEGKHTVHIRFDDHPERRSGSSESNDKETLFLAPATAVQMVLTSRALLKGNRMLFQFTPFNASPAIATFDIRGFDNHVGQILEACPAANYAAWTFPPGQTSDNWPPPKK